MTDSQQEATRLVHVSEFPDDLHDEVANHLALSSVGFSVITAEDGEVVHRPSGSGTLIRLFGRLAILTADHVVDQLLEAKQISLLVDWTGELRRCTYEPRYLHILRLARGADDGDGPDLAVIFLPSGSEATSTLVAHKSFYDLDKRIATLPGNYTDLEWGFWFPCGVPGEGSQLLEPTRGFQSVLASWGLCAVSGRPREFEHEGFDYLDMRVPDEGEGIPTQFGGMSGAGVWHVRFRQRQDGTMYVEDYVLSGVVFYEWYSPNRRLRCHGRRSIHERLPELAKLKLDSPGKV